MKNRSTMTTSLVAVLCATCVLFSTATTLHAQTNTGSILGAVRDPSGAVIPNATVATRVVSTGVRSATHTNEQGLYSFPNLPIGDYVVSVTAKGFKPVEHSAVHVVGSEAVTIDFLLEVGQSIQSIQITGAATRVDTTTATEGNSVMSSEVSELPILMQGSSRNAMAFIGALPGVIGGPSPGVSVTTINGAPEGEESYDLDGVMGTVSGNNQLRDDFAPPPEAIAEMRMDATTSPEHGWNSGIAISMISKSGTNELHGSLFEYLRNGDLNARNFFATQADPSKQNEYGATLGGPLVLPHLYDGRNKTFFFMVYGGFDYQTAAGGQVLTVPTALMRQGDFSEWLAQGRTIYNPYDVAPDGSGGYVRLPFTGNIIPSAMFSKVSTYFQNALPLPNQPGLANNWIGSLAPSSTRSQKGSIKVDHNFGSGRQRVSFAFDDINSTTVNPGAWGAGPLATGVNTVDDTYRIRLIYTATISSNKVFSFRAALNRNGGAGQSAPNTAWLTGASAAGLANPFATVTPTMPIDDLGTLGFTGAGLATEPAWVMPVNIDFNWSKGKHNFKFGTAYARTVQASDSCYWCAGYHTFVDATTGNGAGSLGVGWAAFLLGLPNIIQVNSPLYVEYRTEAIGFYGQDAWRITPKLTLNYGLRLDVVPMLREQHDRISYLDPNEPNPAANGLLGALSFFGEGPGRNGQKAVANLEHPFAPQIGFAYNVRPKTVIRGSYGNSSVSMFGAFASGLNLSGGGGSYGFNWSGTFQQQLAGINSPPTSWDSGFPFTVPSLPDLNPSAENGSFLPTWDRQHLKSGRSQNINFGVEHEFPKAVLVKVNYVGNLSHGVPTGDLIDPSQLTPKYLALGSLLTQDVYSPAAQAAGIPVPYPGYVGSVGLALKPYPQYIGVANTQANVGFSLYHSLQVTAQKRYGDLSFLASYTFSKQLDNYGAFGGNGEGFTFFTIQNTAFWHDYKVLANNDRPQTLVLSWVYHLPLGPGKRWANSTNPFVKEVVGGWRVAGIQTYASGGVITVGSNVTIPAVNVGGGFGPIWPVRVPGVPITRTGCGSYVPGNPGVDEYLNGAAFEDAAPFTLGNTNVLPNVRNCGYFDEDFSLQKEFKIKERVGFLLSGDANNIFNRHAWTGLNTDIDSPGFGQYGGATGPRLIQVHARLSF